MEHVSLIIKKKEKNKKLEKYEEKKAYSDNKNKKDKGHEIRNGD